MINVDTSLRRGENSQPLTLDLHVTAVATRHELTLHDILSRQDENVRER